MSDLESIRNDILREMYDEADPGLDFDEVLENPEDQSEDWFNQHTLSKERQREIYEKHCDENDLNESERVSMSWSAILDLGPAYPTEDGNA